MWRFRRAFRALFQHLKNVNFRKTLSNLDLKEMLDDHNASNVRKRRPSRRSSETRNAPSELSRKKKTQVKSSVQLVLCFSK